MNENEQTPEVWSPLRRVFAVASITSLVSLILFYWAARRAVSQLQFWWVELLVYATIPISVTFIILYRSCWHREIMGAARTGSLLLLSCMILVGDLIAVGIVLCVAVVFISLIAFCINGVTGGNH